MSYSSIRIEGAILSPDILDRLEEMPGQRPGDFGFEASAKVKDEIARSWADAQDYWRIFNRKLDSLKNGSSATTETRNIWMVPLMGLLGYQLEYQARGTQINEKIYPISHRAVNRAQSAIHIIGCREAAGLDRKPEKAALRMSAHALVQEYLNLTEQLYGIVTNGRILRLLRDSSRLVKLTYLEFDLDRIFTDGLFADFALLYRLLHVSRLPASHQAAEESLIERYHQDSLDSGARIREGLSRAVEKSIISFANGFLSHPDNAALREAALAGKLAPRDFYQFLLRLIYRILFLLVIEERNLVYPLSPSQKKRELYYRYYSLQRLRLLSEKRHLAERRHRDLWLAMLSCFRLFEADSTGNKLGIAPLAGDLFNPDALGPLARCSLDNEALMGCLRSLGLYYNPNIRQMVRVNYAALNVEEFGSVYEGLLEYEPRFISSESRVEFAFAQGEERSATGSHYTPDDLVHPLIRHSLDHLIAEKLKEQDPGKALLSLRVADISCGSGHILLAAARRIATVLAAVRTGEEQPSPTAFRTAVRDVIRECIFGVDINPLAVELCKVALWLEAHNPGEPLNFLDHRIKCGNAVVGFARLEEVEQGVPAQAFVAMPGDDKKTAAYFRRINNNEHKQKQLDFAPGIQRKLETVLERFGKIIAMPENTPAQIEAKKKAYHTFTNGPDSVLLSQVASIPIAQFYIPKTKENSTKIITEASFRPYWSGQRHPQGQASAQAWTLSFTERFFHWFLEFPETMERGGFDCILGNPPYLGGQALSGTYGHPFCHYVKWQYAPTGLSDLVVFFVRRIFSLLKPGGFTAFITTNSIKDGDIRKDGLEQVLSQGGSINFAMRGIKWPGRANLVVSLVSIYRGEWKGRRFLDNREAPFISAFFEDSSDAGEAVPLAENANKIFQGSIFLGDGFLLSHEEADRIAQEDPRNKDVIFPVINGQEVNSQPDQAPGRQIINFLDRSEDEASLYEIPFRIAYDNVRPVRLQQKDEGGQQYWWRFLRPRNELYGNIRPLHQCFVAAATTKYLNFSAMPTNRVFLNTLYVFTTDRWDLYSVVQSTLHEVWARKYSGALETRLRYSPSDCFETFPFPEGLWQASSPALAIVGERYHEYRKQLMQRLWLGLTKIYNLFHEKNLTPEMVARVSKKPEEAQSGYQGIVELRALHRELDHAVLAAYGWTDLDLNHGFHEPEYLPENDRMRFTISPGARRELLRRLLAENLRRAVIQETAAQEAKRQEKQFGAKPAVIAGQKKQKEASALAAAQDKGKKHKPVAQLSLDDFWGMTYPSGETDNAICAAALAAVAQAGELSGMDHLDIMLLATHKDWCGKFLHHTDHAAFNSAARYAPHALFVGPQQSIQWKTCRDYLEKRNALSVDRRTHEQAIRPGPDLEAVRRTFPGGVDEVVQFSIKAARIIAKLRENLAPLPNEQQVIIQNMEAFRREYGLVA